MSSENLPSEATTESLAEQETTVDSSREIIIDKAKFNPSDYVMDLKGKDYLPVAARITWYRKEHPFGCIKTEIVSHDPDRKLAGNNKQQTGFACMRAEIYSEDGALLSSGTKTEFAQTFEDYIEKAECVIEGTQILTSTGWKHDHELQETDLVLSYDMATDTMVWDNPIRASIYKRTDTIRVYNEKGFDAIVTPEHTWVSQYQTSDKAVPTYKKRFQETARLNSKDNIITGKLVPTLGTPLSVSPFVTALMGWAICKGQFTYKDDTIKGLRFIISREDHYKALSNILGSILYESQYKEWHGNGYERVNERTGKTYKANGQYIIRINDSGVDTLFNVFGITALTELPAVLSQLAPVAREAMLGAMLLASGTKRGDFTIKQNKTIVHDVFTILCALQGHMVCKTRKRDNYISSVQRIKKTNIVSANMLHTENAGIQTVWCPTTKYGTWVARFPNGMVTLTGNTGAIGRALAALGYGTPLDDVLDEGRICDSPRAKQQNVRKPQYKPMGNGNSNQPQQQKPAAKPTDNKLAAGQAFLKKLCAESSYKTVDAAAAALGWDMASLKTNIGAVKAACDAMKAQAQQQ